MELSRVEMDGPSNDAYDSYELVMFSRDVLPSTEAYEVVAEANPLENSIDYMRRVTNTIAPYAEGATLNAFETLEFPSDFDEVVGGHCYIFDAYKPECFDRSMGLMLIMRIHRDEMSFAREAGGSALLDKLKSAGHYPYSDVDTRPSVLSGPPH